MLAVVIGQQVGLLALGHAVKLALGFDGIESLAVASGADHVYSRLVLGMLANAAPAGIALRLPFVDQLQLALPGLYPGSSQLPTTSWIGVVFAAGSSAVGAQLMQTAFNLVLVAVGSGLLVASSLRKPEAPAQTRARRHVRTAGLLAAACAVGAQLQLSWTSGAPGEMAISMFATKILGMDSAVYDASLSHADWVSPAINVESMVLAGTLGVGIAALIGKLRALRGRARTSAPARNRSIDWRTAAPVLSATLLLLSPLQHGAAFLDESGSANKDTALILGSGQRALPNKPSVVTISGDKGQFEYLVDGSAQFIRGIGYNAVSQGMPEPARIERYQHDFAGIRATGANTITGWDEGEFDEILMQQAAENGLGVILPLNLDAGLAWDDADTREQVLAGLTDRVERFKDSPALRIWGLGNEVIHDLADKRSGNAAAFAGFLIEAADRIHAIDPNHPVIYRDAEDVYLQPVAQALRADGQDRPWFVYGMNFFTTRLEAALAKGPASRLDQPLLISEFGPVGLRGVGRAVVYQQLWKTIAANRGLVLGGCAYVWTTEGPEPLDRMFGLTNGDGQPVDSSLSTLAALYAAGETEDAAATSPAAQQ